MHLAYRKERLPGARCCVHEHRRPMIPPTAVLAQRMASKAASGLPSGLVSLCSISGGTEPTSTASMHEQWPWLERMLLGHPLVAASKICPIDEHDNALYDCRSKPYRSIIQASRLQPSG